MHGWKHGEEGSSVLFVASVASSLVGPATQGRGLTPSPTCWWWLSAMQSMHVLFSWLSCFAICDLCIPVSSLVLLAHNNEHKITWKGWGGLWWREKLSEVGGSIITLLQVAGNSFWIDTELEFEWASSGCKAMAAPQWRRAGNGYGVLGVVEQVLHKWMHYKADDNMLQPWNW